jgi:glycyl-tRNA synthetase beta subunit
MQNTGNWRNINMSKYLLEIGVEELPYKFIPMAISQLEAGFKSFLESNNVGYENISYFHRTFLKRYGISPSQYRIG